MKRGGSILPLVAQIGRFGFVGVLSTLVNAGIYFILINNAKISLPNWPVLANGIGFVCAFLVSFWGHRHWTFANDAVAAGNALSRYGVTSLIGLIINSIMTWLIVERIHFPAGDALIVIVGFTPVMTFLLSKWWAFRPSSLNKNSI